MDLAQFVNPYTLNIFCDASILNKPNGYDGCYGAEAHVKYYVLDTSYKFLSNTTNNNSEINAIKEAVSLAITHKDEYKNINVFSDSQVSLFGIRDRIFNWKVGKDDLLYGSTKTPIASQDVFIEIMHMIVDSGVKICFWHQEGHVNTSNFSALQQACHVFAASNGIRERIDYNLIRYISDCNNKIDRSTRNLLVRDFRRPSNGEYNNVLEFNTNNFYEVRDQYRKMNGDKYACGKKL